MAPEFRQLLEDGDVDGLWRAWGRVAPHLPQPKSREDAEVTMHIARTATRSIPVAAQQYSHRWLVERGLPSQLPADMVPRLVEAVGISVNFHSPYLQPAAREVRTAMEDAVRDRFAMGDKDAVILQTAMQAARDKAMQALFGRGRGR